MLTPIFIDLNDSISEKERIRNYFMRRIIYFNATAK